MSPRTQAIFSLLAALPLAGGCAGDDEAPAAQADAAAAVETGAGGPDLGRGELLSFACQACHALTPAGGPDIGPSLYGVFGRPAAGLAEFEYSEALRGADFIWTSERLDAWLQAPTEFLPGTTMAFAGYGDAGDRAALIAWLVNATAAPAAP